MFEATDSKTISQGSSTASPLDGLLREGARRLLQAAVEAEVAEYIQAHADQRDTDGHRLVVRNGRAPERTIQTGLGDIPVSRPRVNDKRVDSEGRRMRFESQLLPPYLRRTRAVEELLPWL